ncbi:ATP synthase F1 subunit epsilon [Salinarimonas sp.]|uniref:ATP synthase F1 subunit epsilon n=1 Tax=Salinarimonas sp. TaxID=2766526 RepID=UPI00391D63FC
MPFTIDLVSPERILFSGDVESARLPALQGEMTILPGHAPRMAALTTGFLVIAAPGGEKRILVQGGFADIGPQATTVLAERAIPAEEVDGAYFDREIARAEAAAAATEDPDAKEAANEVVFRLGDARAQMGL